MEEKNIPDGEFCIGCGYKEYKTEKEFSKYGGYEGENIVPYCSLYKCNISFYNPYPLYKCLPCLTRTYYKNYLDETKENS